MAIPEVPHFLNHCFFVSKESEAMEARDVISTDICGNTEVVADRTMSSWLTMED